MSAEHALKLQWNRAVADWQRRPTAENKRRVIELGKKINPQFNLSEKESSR